MAIDYSKWDHLDDDEGGDELAAAAPHPGGGGRAPEAAVDEELHAFFAAAVAGALPDASAEERATLLRFLRVQDPRGEKSNVLLCSQIVELLMQAPGLATQTSLDRACALTRRLCFGEGGGRAPDGAAPVLLSAVNTLAACVEVGAINLFASISAPRGAEAEEMRLRYEQAQFGKRYMLEYMGWGDEGAASDADSAEQGGRWCTLQ